MARANSEDGNGALQLPIGFRFHPTDEELLVHYLKRKIYSLPLPASVIPDLENISQSSPWDLPGELKLEKKYFFCQKKRSIMNKCSTSLSTDCGYWRPTGKAKQIMAAPGTNLLIGIRKSFVFYQRKSNSSTGFKRTQWILQEFCLVGSVKTPFLPQKLMMQVGDWVVCRVYQRKKKKSRNQGKVHGKKSWGLDQGIGARDCMNSFDQTNSSSSCSSGVTAEISANELDQEESTHNVG